MILQAGIGWQRHGVMTYAFQGPLHGMEDLQAVLLDDGAVGIAGGWFRAIIYDRDDHGNFEYKPLISH